ncbi:MAG: hypothetical protein DDT19_01955 [Syntrophomonadaceae bacterium]|nr:hypothetical protein [Bacillota bacterium]
MNRRNEEDSEIYQEFLRYKGLPADLWPRFVYEDMPTPAIRRDVDHPARPQPQPRADLPPHLGDAIFLSKAFASYPITVTTTPILIIKSTYTHPYMILNPSRSLGLASIVTGFSGVVSASGNSQHTPIGVASFEEAHVHLTIHSFTGTGSYEIIARTFDSVTATWKDSQIVFSGINLAYTSPLYAYIGRLGIVTDLAFRWVLLGTATMNFTLAVVLKGGTGMGALGFANSVFLGGSGVTTQAGFPLLPGSRQSFVIEENVELWGIADADTTIRVFVL